MSFALIVAIAFTRISLQKKVMHIKLTVQVCLCVGLVATPTQPRAPPSVVALPLRCTPVLFLLHTLPPLSWAPGLLLHFFRWRLRLKSGLAAEIEWGARRSCSKKRSDTASSASSASPSASLSVRARLAARFGVADLDCVAGLLAGVPLPLLGGCGFGESLARKLRLAFSSSSRFDSLYQCGRPSPSA